MPASQKIILVDEQPIILEALNQAFQQVPGFDVIAAFTHSDRAFFEIMNRRPDLVMLDLELPGRTDRLAAPGNTNCFLYQLQHRHLYRHWRAAEGRGIPSENGSGQLGG
jgi:DNA-binding NarL/FixJ family response regulator